MLLGEQDAPCLLQGRCLRGCWFVQHHVTPFRVSRRLARGRLACKWASELACLGSSGRLAVTHQWRLHRPHPCRGQQQHHVRPILSGVHATWQPMGAGVGWPGAAGSQALDCAAVQPLWNRLLDGCWTLAARQFMLRNQSPPSLPPPQLPRTLCSISGAVHAPRRQDLPHFDRRFTQLFCKCAWFASHSSYTCYKRHSQQPEPQRTPQAGRGSLRDSMPGLALCLMSAFRWPTCPDHRMPLIQLRINCFELLASACAQASPDRPHFLLSGRACRPKAVFGIWNTMAGLLGPGSGRRQTLARAADAATLRPRPARQAPPRHAP